MKVKINDLFCYIQLYSLIHLLIFVLALKNLQGMRVAPATDVSIVNIN